MDDGGLYLHDVVRPGGKRCARTIVSRTLVGDPGSTYRYLGLRLFSHPWVDVDDDGDAIPTKRTTGGGGGGSTLRDLGYPPDTVSSLLSMGIANSYLVVRTNNALDEHVAHRVVPRGLVGSAEFNLTLVNKMEPDASGARREKDYGMGKVSVGWHRDSGLKDYSSIAVYQTLKGTTSNPTTKKSKTEITTKYGDGISSSSSWGVALRAMDGGSGGPLLNIPPLLVPLPSGSVYYMLDDFNHNHEHAVISPSIKGDEVTTIRYSSTHRVAREGRGTWQYIREKARSIMSKSDIPSSSSRKERETFISYVRGQQNLMTEIEFEWLRQWFVQGQRHASLHPYWHRPIRFLCDVYCNLERAMSDILDLLSRSAGSTERPPGVVTEDLFDVLIESFVERSALRSSWSERYRDPIYAEIPKEERPFPCPCLDREGRCDGERGQLSEDLNYLVSQLRQWRSEFVLFVKEKSCNQQGGDHHGKIMLGAKKLIGHGKLSKSVGSLTKKELKNRASNWERLKANLRK
ncbi:hypothetical protein ACHAXA_000658 [Cyclostephanos tholiformis]|uniref:Alpha-ketoglutarate-dependent dioxygenase FTO n=1 Tax=Cyclostephanos tholiformis TaxID=382380 RepID=A0ABD3SCG6_9STRA